MLKRGDIVVCNVPPEGTKNICHNDVDGGIGIVTVYESEHSVFLIWVPGCQAHRYEHGYGDIFVPEDWLTKLGEVPHG